MSQFKRDMTEKMRDPDYAYEFGRTERQLEIVALIERIICFDALADDDGRCNHHGGKCYDIRQLIKRLESK